MSIFINLLSLFYVYFFFYLIDYFCFSIAACTTLLKLKELKNKTQHKKMINKTTCGTKWHTWRGRDTGTWTGYGCGTGTLTGTWTG